jgi:hypothetical protein
MKDEELWPDVLEEIEPLSDVDMINDNAKLTTLFEGLVQGKLSPGARLQLFTPELSIAGGEHGATIYVFDAPVWSGPCEEITDIHTYRTTDTGQVMIVAVNKKIVWADIDLVKKTVRQEGGDE